MALYTVSFLHTDGSRQVSRFFQTRRAAQKWAKWLASTRFCVRAFVYRGREGCELLEEIGG